MYLHLPQRKMDEAAGGVHGTIQGLVYIFFWRKTARKIQVVRASTKQLNGDI